MYVWWKYNINILLIWQLMEIKQIFAHFEQLKF